MERLTQRDRKGRAWFDNDGALIRGANGSFHIKRDMTAHFIHDRFVALDKVLDRLAAYEDTGLEPEEIRVLAAEQENAPLTLDELRGMDGEWAWMEEPEHIGQWAMIAYIGGTYRMVRARFFDGETADVEVLMQYHDARFYRRKPEGGA